MLETISINNKTLLICYWVSVILPFPFLLQDHQIFVETDKKKLNKATGMQQLGHPHPILECLHSGPGFAVHSSFLQMYSLGDGR